MSVFTPVSGSLGGSLIGFSAASLLLGNGDIMGCSGIVTSIFIRPKETIASIESRWRVVYVLVFLLTSKLLVVLLTTTTTAMTTTMMMKEEQELQPIIISDLGYCIAGLLVGLGTRLGNGCTSGHGICGLARRSKRSFAAVMTFMSTAMLTATIWPPKGPFVDSRKNNNNIKKNEESFYPTPSSILVSNVLIIGFFILLVLTFVIPSSIMVKGRDSPHKVVVDHHQSTKVLAGEEKETKQNQGQQEQKSEDDPQEQPLSSQLKHSYPRKAPVAALSAVTFSAGLYISGMVKPHKVHDFLDLKLIPQGSWDGTLMVVMGCGLLMSALGYHFVKGYNTFRNDHVLECPLLQMSTRSSSTTNSIAKVKFNIPTNTNIDRQLILGSALFGVGWGLGSLCVGSALFLVANGYQQVLRSWWPCMIIGSFLGEKAKKFI